MSSTGEAVGAIAGGIIGGVLYGPTGAVQGAAIGGSIGAAVDPADLPGYDGPRLSDPSEQTTGFGVGLFNVDGTVKIPGHVFWIENNSRREVAKKTDTGGKGGGGSQESTTYEYFGTFAVMLTDHQLQSIKRLWDVKGLVLNTEGTDLNTAYATSDVFPLAHLYDSGSTGPLKAALQATPVVGPKGQIRLYPGFDDQMPDPRMEADLGVGSCPAFRGRAYLMFYDWPLPQEYGQSIAGAQIAAEVVRSADAGAAVLLNEVQVTKPSGYIDPACQYLTKTMSRLYVANGVADPSTPATAFGVISVGPHGVEPSSLSTGILSSVNHTNGKGITDTDIGQIGLSNAVNLFSAFPGRLSIGSAKFARSGAQGSGIWYATTSTNTLYYGDEETDSNISLALGAECFDVAIDESGNCIALFNNSIRVYDATLTLIRMIDTTGIAGVGGTFTTDAVWLRYDAPIAYVCKSAGNNHPERIYPFDMDTETAGSLVTLRDISAVYATPNDAYVNINIEGQIITRFSSWFNTDPGFDALIEHYRMPTPSGAGEDLATVVRRRLEQSELIESGDIDVTDLTGTVRGYQTRGVSSVRGQLQPLMTAYQFDMIQDGYQIKCVMRGNASSGTIDPDDLDARPFGNAPGTALSQSREMDTQLPSKVIVRHLDADRDYEVNEQYSQTQGASRSVNVEEMDLSIVFTPTEAAGVAETVWARRWLERASFSFTLPPTYRNLQPTDVLTLTTDYATYEFFIQRALYDVGGVVHVEAVLNDSAIYTPNAVGGTSTGSATTVGYGGNSAMFLLDIPAIQDAYDTYGFPAAMCGYASSWPGGVIARSIDTGQTWQPIQGYSGPVVSGVVETPLGQDDGYVINYTDQLTVQFNSPDMTISSITEAQMKTGMNWFAYGAADRWEIGLFANATDNGDGTYTLDTILRGAKGTEWAAGLHEAYDTFVFLSDADMSFIGVDINSLSVERLFKGITSGQDIDNVTSQSFTYAGVNFKPYAPVQLDANLSGSDWVLTWKRRSRLQSTYWNNGTAVPIGEASESYEIDIMDGSTVVRTLTATSETVTYTSAQQTTDFGGNQSSITFRVYQLSATVGRGYESEATV